eukprot:TRINITY_DN17920_c0_g1_i1.p1 TRINITY_DN17920_c0_g1~~TRINITY_DN17920_c0_g1_i1.p1  ORF type:complete len:296 (-),score=43.46 TRINITY_DN17920_c0_g1_i1:514-1362(-)
MVSLRRFILPIRASLNSFSLPNSSLSHSRYPFFGKYDQLKTWVKGFEPLIQTQRSRFQYMLNMERKCMHNLSTSEKKICMGSFFGVSVVTGWMSIRPNVSYAMDGNDILVEENHADIWDASGCLEDDPYTIWAFVRKFWLPAMLVVTVVMDWRHPITLAIKIAFFLFSTKPRPFSIYLYIEQLRQQSMRHNPGLGKLKLFYAKKVEVEDYGLLCLAKVELRDEKIFLIGILGSWWVLKSSRSHGDLSLSLGQRMSMIKGASSSFSRDHSSFWRSFLRSPGAP